MKELVIIAHNLRSAHNVGSLLRTAEGLGVKVILSGYTPYPQTQNDARLPHLALKTTRQISKTALGAEKRPIWQRQSDIQEVIASLQGLGFVVTALEQNASAVPLSDFVIPQKLAIILGRETEGVEADVLARCHAIIEIPMFGHKESFNVVQAAAMAMYRWRFDA